MEALAGWEKVLVGALAAVLVVWLWPGLRSALQRSQEAEKDWGAALLPLAVVVLFVILLIALV